jgi:hypothetical protein
MSLPPSEIPLGAMRFNSDSQKLEYWDGSQWVQVHTFSPNLNGGARGVFGGGNIGPAITNVIEYITINTTGNAIDFGDLTQVRVVSTACSSSTRGVFGGGSTPTTVNTIEYITISSTGNAQDFGDLSVGKSNLTSCSSSTRGVFGGGATPTIVNTIDFITISSTGNALDFGDLTQVRFGLAACSSSTRGLFAGGISNPSPLTNSNTIDYITIASTGNAIDFGDLTITIRNCGACSNATRGLFGGGVTPTPTITRLNVIEYIAISSAGNAIDFGDLIEPKGALSACSNAHGGL